ncbi:putative disease resistance protein RGA3 isoform X2 [Trifolium pratense]|uniref:putative disease resistance protein RGA3 isoform X2 n=1 Tax=Trifolium pratense TaxID=57577 RepID=UPI001E69773E|nr:putative disease resistance protein RGA3 isoform X2 [Trifolium pratense]
MAEALLGVAFENLMALLQNEFSTISGISSKAQKLSTNLNLIKVVLEDAEKKQVTNCSIKVWLQQLKDAVYVLDDILDECSIESNRLKGSSSLKPKNIIFRHNIGNRLKEITSRFDEIADRKNKFLLQDGVTVKEMTVEVAEWRQTSSIIAEPKVYGREDDKEKIVEFLLNQERDSNSLSVYPIFGLGGVGKTTLAQLVYNDQRVSTTNFHTKIWVCVSEAFSVKRILCSIIESIKNEKCDAFDLDVIQRKVQELLQGKRYLLVLDDVWNKNEELEFGLSQEKWNQLKSVLSNGSKGSSCLVSTRDEVVASIMGTCQAHHLSGLSENECWLLLKQYAFGDDIEEQVELVEIGKDIAKKCGGLPLAAQALGGLMCSRSGEKEWLEIKESRLWDSSSDNYILPALRLSYSYLTPTLKQCFTFCAIFPKDTEILKEELIHLWMAHGFISSRKNLEVEDVGSIIWNELCKKSFFQDIKMAEYSGDISFKMHDLVHDLAQSIMGQECLYLEYANMTSLSKSTHHISVHSDDLLSIDEGAFKKVESLRTFFQLNRYTKKKHHCFPTNRFLRVLCTSFIHVPSLGSLIHLSLSEAQEANLMCKKDLQELWLSWEITSGEFTQTPTLNVEQLFEVLQPHSNLKRLKIRYYEGLFLPSWISILSNLVALQLKDCKNCVRLMSFGKLQSLKKLELINMINLKYLDDECHDGMEVRVFPSLEILVLHELPNIEGLLKVEIGDVFPCLSKLIINSCPKLGLPCLQSLNNLYVKGCNNELLRSISTFCGLTTLTLVSGDEEITSFPEAMFSNLTILQTLTIFYFPKLKELPNQPFNIALEHLEFSHCDELELLPEQIWNSLQSLRTMWIGNCKGLRCLPEGIRHLTSLEVLTIHECPTLEERCKEGTGDDWDKIAHIPKLRLW